METQDKIDPTLQSFRQQIDAIDDKIISLLSERMAVVSQVAEYKTNKAESFFIKAAREADMIKSLAKRAPHHFPAATIVGIWRKIIAVSNMREQKISIAIHNPKNISDLTYLVREYYSENVPLHNFDSTASVVSELENGKAQIAVFTLPQSENSDEQSLDNSENWWIRLANNKLGLRIFALIPFVEFVSDEKKIDQFKLVAVAAKEPEKSSEDSTLLYLETDKMISKSTILAALKLGGLSGKILKSVKLPQVEGVMFHLAELEGFYLENDDAIVGLKKSAAKAYVKVLGHYAKAVKVSL